MYDASKVRFTAQKVDVRMEAFEHFFFRVLNSKNADDCEKDQAAIAFYDLQDIMDDLVEQLKILAEHMEVCDAIYAVNAVDKLKVIAGKAGAHHGC